MFLKISNFDNDLPICISFLKSTSMVEEPGKDFAVKGEVSRSQQFKIIKDFFPLQVR